jgi:hypothetical protein
MSTFSQRYGYTSIERAFQRERVDKTLRISLWNALKLSMWDSWKPWDVGYTAESERIHRITRRLWLHYFKRDMDALPAFKDDGYGKRSAYGLFKDYFNNCAWYEVYDFIEFLIRDKETFLDNTVIKWLNSVLEKENAAYRIVGSKVVEITDTNEMKTIENALKHPDAPVRNHIQSALEKMSDREKPDYRNSIKESISAVEAMCRLVTGMKSATLADALKKIPNLHPALQKAFVMLYGFTSDASGVRHSLLEESQLTYPDAKFMLAACSSFVSYLRASTMLPADAP